MRTVPKVSAVCEAVEKDIPDSGPVPTAEENNIAFAQSKRLAELAIKSA
ncbi:hypothetical protein NMA510612_0786 [Neisseria meningitidis]|uniref:Uncharacterized protein n=1 Tax=Neisseria meningitidis TaxID=487 RepID=X5EQ33_NEIME|nr:hypothetical protein NMA510612_0786 [Neisseria meningitidis]